MKTAKPSAPDASSSASRRAQPVRQTRINPPRTSSLNRGNSFPGAPHQEQPIDIFPAVTHFADAITALPKELVRHFTLLKEVDAKIFAPEAALFQLIDAALNTPAPEPTRSVNDASSSVAPASTPMSVQNSTTGSAVNANHTGVPSNSDSVNAAAFDPSNMPRRQLFRQAAWKIQEMLVSLEEKNHVISTANEALGKQMGRIEEIWPHLENEFSEEAKWGSTTHWAYVENRPSKTNHTQAERSRREGAATLSAAAQQLAEEAAARSSDRKQALAAKKNSKTQAAETEPDAKAQDSAKKPPGNSKSRKHPVESPAPPIGLGISTTPASNGTAPSKRRKVDSAKTNGAVPAERAMSTVFGSSAQKPKTTSPRETPVPETTSKKRKALPTSSSQAKKSRTNVAAMSPSVATSPMVGTFPENVKIGRSSPVPPPPAPPRPTSSRARQNSTQPNGDITRRPLSAASNKPNGIVPPATPEVVPQSNGAKANTDVKAQKETVPPVASIPRPVKPETETPPPPPDPVPNGNSKKEVVAKTVEEREPKRDSATPAATPMPVTPAIAATAATTATTTTTTTTTTVTTKSGRASKPSTPALATFAEAATARSRPSRNAEAGGNNGAATTPATTATKRSHKKGASSISAAAAAIAIQAAQQQTGHETGAVAGKKDASAGAQQGGDRSSNHVNNESSSNGNNASGNSNSNSNVNNSLNKDDDDDDRDVDEQRYCLCNEISYGEMVACDGDGCAREWFHLDCVGLKVAPKGNAKWYCEDCKKRLQRR